MPRHRGRWKPDERCEAALEDNVYHRTWTDMRCAYHVAFRVGEKRLCSRHASIELLHIAVREARVQQLPPHPKPPYSAVQIIDDRWKPK